MAIDASFADKNEYFEQRIPFEDVPLRAMSLIAKKKLSGLNHEKVFKSEDGYYRDWRGIFALSKLPPKNFEIIAHENDKINKLVQLWILDQQANSEKPVNFDQFLKCLEFIDRYDVYDDVLESLANDAQIFLQSRSINENLPDSVVIIDNENPTNSKFYDAFVLYHDKDEDFVREVISKLEHEMGFSLYVKDRDCRPGVAIECAEMVDVISNQCEYVIAIMSNAFLQNSSLETFLINYGHSIGIQNNTRKVIPCLRERCEMPQMLKFCFRLEFFKKTSLFDPWEKLRNALTRDIESPAMNRMITSSNKFITQPKSDDTEVKRKIFPPPPSLRAASSMLSIPEQINGLKKHSKISNSTACVNVIDEGKGEKIGDIVKKRKKWYDMFRPPKIASSSACETDSIKEKSEKKSKDKHKNVWKKLLPKDKKSKKKKLEPESSAC